MQVNGDIPFETDSQIKRANLHFRTELRLSTECQDLVRRCLEIDVGSRITLAEMRDHPWLKEVKVNTEEQKTAMGPLEDVTPSAAKAALPQLMRTLSKPVDVPVKIEEETKETKVPRSSWNCWQRFSNPWQYSDDKV